jgi:predicted nucleic acid-binding protein
VIVVDTSVWIDYFAGRTTVQVGRLRSLIGRGVIVVGDLILVETLQGLPTEAEANRVETVLRRFQQAAMLDPERAPLVAANYRKLRAKGITIRKTIDVVIGTFCIVTGHALLHADRDFSPMVEHLGLKSA